MCRQAVGSAVIRRANTVVETRSTREIKTCDDLFHKGQAGRRWISGAHTRTRPLIWLWGGGRLWWMSTLLFWQGNLLQSWQCVMEAQEIPGAAPFSILKGRATRQTELDGPFIVWPMLSWVTVVGASLFTKVPRDKRRGERKKTGATEKIHLRVSSVFLQKHSNRYITFLKTWFFIKSL